MKRAALASLLLLPVLAHADLTLTLNPGALSDFSPPHRVHDLANQHIANSIIYVTDRPQVASPGVDPATLRWKNGGTLKGNITGASATDLTWTTSLFEDPLRLQSSVLDRIDWPANPVQPVGPFAIALRDGSFIYGDISAIGADSISIHSARHGGAVLKRSQVLSARRLQNGSLLYAGPLGDFGWQAMSSQPDGTLNRNSPQGGPPSTFATGPGGALLFSSWNRSGILDVTWPNRVDLEFRLHSSKRPEFSLVLGQNTRQALRIETWDDELVVAAADQFKLIKKLQENDRELDLRLCWDRTTKHCSLYTAGGELLAEWDDPVDSLTDSSGVILQNRGIDLSLDFLRIRNWNGQPPAKVDPAQAHVELADGRTIAGSVSGGAAGTIHLPGAGNAVPLSEVNALIFTSSPVKPENGQASLHYNDGAVIFGNVSSVSNGRATIESSFAQGSFSAQLDSPRQLRFRRSPSPLAAATAPPVADDQDKIHIGGTTIEGQLGSAADGSLGWIPPGGLNAARPSTTLPSEITRSIPADLPPSADTALFYLTSGDILPGKLGSLDRTGAEFQSTLMPARKIPADELQAIEFRSAAELNVQGFSDPGWQIVKGTDASVRRNGNTLQMDGSTSIAYPGLMQSSEIGFKFTASGFTAVRFRMFCSKWDPAHSTNLILGYFGAQFLVGQESIPGQLDDQVQVKIKPGDPVAVRLKIAVNQVEVFVNDASVQVIPIDPANRSGSGMIIEPSSLWGNAVNPVSLSDFTARSGPGPTWLPDINADAKAQVLTVPRFQKDDPPRHLLLAANGDVLRGEIEAATDSHFGFRSGLENLDVPRDRVRAVIWLKPPDPNAPPAPVEKPEPGPLDQHLQMRVNFGMIGVPQVASFLMAQAPGLRIKAPDITEPRTAQIQIGNQSVGEAINVICAKFNLESHVTPEGLVVLETAADQASTGLPLKSYWLKPDAIPKNSSAEDFLTSKGLTFPEGASVQWQPSSGLLSMTNSPDNQAKLAALVTSDFGGGLGSPTGWIKLMDGAQLALAIDQVGKDFIVGHHPLYGSIKVPMDQVYAIDSAPPDPSPSVRELENWRLVNAPEPVIPEGGGEVSPLLGKDALPFTLPLLAGGSFDLSGQKGHVVILDFWATWCAPCVKSLPEIIDSLSTFPPDQVKFIGVNQGESPEQVKRFLAARGLNFPVGMDGDQSVAQKYGVDAIPHTVIVGPDGKIAWVQTGAAEDGDTSASDIVKKLLSPPDAKAPADHL